MNIYKQALDFKTKYPKTIAWRLKAHSKIAQMHIWLFTCISNIRYV